jgi:hypothetical protein
MKYIYSFVGYIFAGLMFTLALPLILIYSMHRVALHVSIMVTDGLKDSGIKRQ